MPNSYGSVTVTSTATKIADTKSFRRGLLIFNGGSEALYIGMDSSVTTSTGLPILANATFLNSGYLDLWRGPVWGIVTTGPVDCRFWDWEEV